MPMLCRLHLLVFSHPDFTVGIGITPIHPIRVADYTAGKELHLTPKTNLMYL